MNNQMLSRHYNQLTVEERVRLTLAASARRDTEEVIRLMAQCPQIELKGPDPRYLKLLTSMWLASDKVLLDWVEVSHLVIRDRMVMDAFNLLASAYEAQTRYNGKTGGEDTVDPEAIVRECRTNGAKAKAQCKKMMAIWKGIELGITRFCAEIGLSTDELFATFGEMFAIEEARHLLDADTNADRGCQVGVYRQLRQAWLLNAEAGEDTETGEED